VFDIKLALVRNFKQSR